MKTLRIFVSSPGDVGRERVLAGHVLNRLQGEFSRRVLLEPYFWEHEPMRATTDFQGSIPKPSEFDIVICILWSRLGSPLNEKYRRSDGSPYASGTEYEFEAAAEARKLAGKPELLVYRNQEQPMIPIEPEKERTEKVHQYQALQGFLQRWFLNPDGTVRIASKDYKDRAEFEEKLETDLRKLIKEIAPPLAGPQADAVRSGTYAKGSPFRQLRPFEFEDAEIFFGRTKGIDEVVSAMRDQAAAGSAFTLIFGSSGSGKSSLARAGVLPLLVCPGAIEGIGLWRRALVRPSDGPDAFTGLAMALMEANALPELSSDAGATTADLAKALREAPGGVPLLLKSSLSQAARDVQAKEGLPTLPTARLVILVDQFEEIFTQPARFPPETRGQFVRALSELARSGAVWVLATLRSEFFSRCEEIPELMKLKSGKGQCQLMPPTESELRQIVRLPAIAAGLQFEIDAEGNHLDDVLVDAAGRNPGSLPLLEFALEELYKRRRDDCWLTHAALRELKGIEGALETAAEGVYTKLSPEVAAEFEAVFRGLATTDLSDKPSFLRRIADLDSLGAKPARRTLVEAFVEGRLLVTGSDAENRPVVQVAHEALFLHWPRLQKVLDDNREFLRRRARAGNQLSLWQADRKDRSYLWWHGQLLTAAQDLLAHPEDLSPGEIAFAQASLKAGQSARRNRWLAIAGSLLVALAAGASGFVWWQSWRLKTEQERLRGQLAHVLAEGRPEIYAISDLARRILAGSPADATIWAHYAQALLAQADYAGFDAALRDWEQNVQPPSAEIENLRGDREAKEGRTEKAIGHWMRYLESASLNLEARRTTWRKLARAHSGLGQWAEARDRLTDWINAEDNLEARVLRAKANQQRKKWDEVREDIDAARKMDPAHPDVKNFGPTVEPQAITPLNERVRKSPRDPEAWLARATALTRERQFPAALEDVERALNLDPDAALLLFAKAHLLWQLEQPIPVELGVVANERWTREETKFLAVFDAERAALEPLAKLDRRVREETESAAAYLERGETLARLAHHELAVRDFTRALVIDERSEASFRGRAASYRALQQTEAADADEQRMKELAASGGPNQ